MKNKLSKRILNKYYNADDHPFRIFEDKINSKISPELTILDAGCGSGASILFNLVGRANKLIGIDLVKFDPILSQAGIILLNNDLSKIDIDDSSVDLVISRSVLEHLSDVESIYKEIHRILRPGGSFLFLVPNLWDYVSIISYLIPNKFHAFIISKLTEREAKDVFPTYYKSNTERSIKGLASITSFDVESIEHLGQYPYMLEFNGFIFYIGVLYDKLITRFSKLKYLRGWLLAELIKKV